MREVLKFITLWMFLISVIGLFFGAWPITLICFILYSLTEGSNRFEDNLNLQREEEEEEEEEEYWKV